MKSLKKSLNCFIFFQFFVIGVNGQSTLLTGAIVVGKTELMSYRIIYELNDKNTLTGYSINDFNGNQETKARITGVYDPRKKTLTFEEKNIINTRSKLPLDEFCLMEVNGKFEKKAGKFMYIGSFRSKSSNKKIICDSGTIVLTTEKIISGIAKKVTKAIEKAPATDSAIRELSEKTNPLKEIRKLIQLVPGSTTEFGLKSDSLQIDLFDDRIQDGDRITVLKNERRVVTDFEITNRVKSLKFIINKDDKSVSFTITANNEGSIPPATVKAVLKNGNESEFIVANLEKGQSVRMTFVRK